MPTARPREGGSRARAEALLAATNRFLSAADVDELARTIISGAAAIIDPWKAAVILVDAGGAARVAAIHGYAADERARLEAAVAGRGPGIRLVLAGQELWSDDRRPRVALRIADYGGRTGFSLPIVTASGIAGCLAVLYADDRRFDDPFRAAARGLCTQAGLALDLTGAHDQLRRQATALERETRVNSALFEISQKLAALTDPDAVPGTLAAAIRGATGASYSVVARWDPARGRVAFLATEGLSDVHRAALDALEATPDRFRMIRGGIEGRAAIRVPPFDPSDVPLELVHGLGLTALAGAPIIVDGRPWGVIAVATVDGDPSIVETGAELLTGLASIASSAIGRTEAVAALERQAGILESAIAERTNQLREAVAELRLASQAKTDFLANVSHELRTPLTAILGFSEVLLQRLDGPLTADQLEDVGTIDRSGRRLLELIDDLIDISRIEAGRIELRREPIDLHELIASTVEEVRALAGQKGLSLNVEAADLPATIVADPGRLHEILLNLLSNAVKFTPSGGSVRVTAVASGDQVRIEVADTGIGIPAEHRDRVFEKFHRIGGPEYPGTGLGLAIAREFAQLHGGDLILASTVGLGTVFTVILPAHPPGADSDAPKVADPAGAPEPDRAAPPQPDSAPGGAGEADRS